jgi:hypothetical protein
MGLDMYLNSVPKVKSIAELKKMEIRLAEAHFAGELEEELNAIQKEKGFIWPIPIIIERFPETKEKYEEYKAADGHVVKVSVSIKAAYWRKFNALHSWFVKNVQKGVDECEEYIVTEKHLERLLKDLTKITPENAKDVLPTAEGFFFGDTDYDEYYWREINNAKATVMYLLTQIEHRERTLIYQSSW